MADITSLINNHYTTGHIFSHDVLAYVQAYIGSSFSSTHSCWLMRRHILHVPPSAQLILAGLCAGIYCMVLLQLNSFLLAYVQAYIACSSFSSTHSCWLMRRHILHGPPSAQLILAGLCAGIYWVLLQLNSFLLA